MGVFDDKMTALADAVRGRFGINEELTLDDMTFTVATASLPDSPVNHDSPSVDVSVVSATAEDVLSGKVFVDSSGKAVMGSISTVTATVSSNAVTVPSGYIAESNVFTVGTALASTTYTPGTVNQTIPADVYTTGVQTILGDTNLKAENIKKGVSIFSIVGSYEGAEVPVNPYDATITYGYINRDSQFQALDLSGSEPVNSGFPIDIDAVMYMTGQDEPDYTIATTATAENIARGYTAVLNGVKTIGSMPMNTISVHGNEVTVSAGYSSIPQTATVGEALGAMEYTPGTEDTVIPAGKYLTGAQTIKGDANLLAENIKAGVTIFGVTGTYEGEGGGDDPGDDVVATSEDLIVSDCGIESYNGVYKIQTPGSTGTSRKWVHTSGNSTIYWSGGFMAWLLCEEPNNNSDENDFRTSADDPAGATWSAIRNADSSYTPPTVKYGGGSGDSDSSSIDPDKVTSFKITAITPDKWNDGCVQRLIRTYYVWDGTLTGTSRDWRDTPSAEQTPMYSAQLYYNDSWGGWLILLSGPGTMFKTTDANPFTSTNWVWTDGNTPATITFEDIVTA